MNCVRESLQLLVANAVEFHVLLKLLESFGPSNPLEHGQMLEDDLGND